MRIGKDMIKQAEAQFLMDCALPPESAGTRQGYLIGKKPGMPEQDFMTDVSYGYLVRECMEKAAAGLRAGGAPGNLPQAERLEQAARKIREKMEDREG